MRECYFFNLTAHKQLWNWLAENPCRGKRDWLGWKSNGGEYEDILCLCFACEYDSAYCGEIAHDCTHCPLIWDNYTEGVAPECSKGNSVFRVWDRSYYNEGDEEIRVECARRIANLRVKEGVLTI